MDARGGRAAGRAAAPGLARSRGAIGRCHGARPRAVPRCEMQRKAIADLVESLTVLQAQDKAAAISISRRGRSSGGAAHASRRQARQCRLSPERGLRRSRDGRANGAGNACRRMDGADRGGGGMSDGEEGKSHELVIIRRRANEDEGGHHGGVWKIAYADFMTAMMAFFLVMWLINSTDKKTLTQVATYFNPMRLTDKRPSPKGLDEPDGSEGKEYRRHRRAQRRRTATPRAPRRSRMPSRARSARAESPFTRYGRAGAEEPDASPERPPARARARPGAGPSATRSTPSTAPRLSRASLRTGAIARTTPPAMVPPPPTVEGSRGPTGETRIAIPMIRAGRPQSRRSLRRRSRRCPPVANEAEEPAS